MPRHTKALILSTGVALLAFSILAAGCAQSTDLLPHSVYYLSGPQGDHQVWRLERDGVTTTQLTDEQSGIDRFSVSRADGSLAYIAGNQLVIVDPGGKNRRLVAESVQGSQGGFSAYVADPVFSPDGGTLAYALDGLHLYHLSSGEDIRVLKDGGNLLGESFVFTQENYAPGPWSPAGDKLLIIMGYFEGSTLAIMEPGEAQPFKRLWSHGPLCCTFHWTPDGKYVLVANASFGVDWPGMWRYDAETGEETELVTTQPGHTRFAGWPVQLPSGDLIYFSGEEFTIEGGIPLAMARIGPDGEDQIQIRPEIFQIMAALWAEDGSQVLLVTPPEGQNPETGAAQLISVRPDGSPIQILLEEDQIRELQWGP